MGEGSIGGVAVAGAAAEAVGVPATINGQIEQAPGMPKGGTEIHTDPSKSKPKLQAAPEGPKLKEYKIDGQIIKMTEAEADQYVSLGVAGYKRMAEAAKARKEADAYREKYEKDPIAAIKDSKMSREEKRAALERYYKEEFMDQDAMSPEQKELNELKKWRAEKESKEKKDFEEKAAAEKQQQEAQAQAYWREKFSNDIMQAIDSAGNLPKSPFVVGRMAFYLSQNLEHKLNLPMEHIIGQVRKDYREEFKGFAAPDAPAEALIEMLGDEAVDKLIKYKLAKHKAKLAESIGQPPPAVEIKKKEIKDPSQGWRKTTSYWTRHDK